jgi:CubicO group peptidase (beta-lactamase class C family)
MIALPRTLFRLLAALSLSSAALTALRAESADDLWKSSTPESQGFSPAKLEAVRAGLAARKTEAFLVIRNDAIVCEWYAAGFGAQQKHGTASLAKALIGGLSFAVAMTDGRIALDDPAVKFIPQWRDDPRKSRITLRQLGSHTSGIEDAEEDGKVHGELTGWKGDFWKRSPVPNDPFTLAREKAPLVFEPGEKMQYSNPGIALLTYCVTAALRDAPQKDIRSLLRERVMQPIGISDKDWSAGYGQTFNVDGLPLIASWGGASFTTRAAARVGRLMLRSGDWNGKRVLSADAVRLTTTDAGTPGPCGMGWWSNNEGDFGELPRDAFFGSGAGHEIVLVIPSLNLIAVRFGNVLEETVHTPSAFHEPYRQFLFDPLMEAITGAVPNKLPAQQSTPPK